jgi:hypothetical protein
MVPDAMGDRLFSTAARKSAMSVRNDSMVAALPLAAGRTRTDAGADVGWAAGTGLEMVFGAALTLVRVTIAFTDFAVVFLLLIAFMCFSQE